MKTYSFILPNGREQRTDANREDLVQMIDAALKQFPMETDAFGRLIVTNEFLFAELMKQIQEAMEKDNGS